MNSLKNVRRVRGVVIRIAVLLVAGFDLLKKCVESGLIDFEFGQQVVSLEQLQADKAKRLTPGEFIQFKHVVRPLVQILKSALFQKGRKTVLALYT